MCLLKHLPQGQAWHLGVPLYSILRLGSNRVGCLVDVSWMDYVKMWDTQRSVKWEGSRSTTHASEQRMLAVLPSPPKCWIWGTLSRCGALKSKKLLCLEGETPEREGECTDTVGFLVRPVPTPVRPSEPAGGYGFLREALRNPGEKGPEIPGDPGATGWR